eukprot:523544-Prorocentrum_minimum.AAC.1
MGWIRERGTRQTDLRVMLAGPKGRAVGESGELDRGRSTARDPNPLGVDLNGFKWGVEHLVGAKEGVRAALVL